jgi:hypothetical protein
MNSTQSTKSKQLGAIAPFFIAIKKPRNCEARYEQSISESWRHCCYGLFRFSFACAMRKKGDDHPFASGMAELAVCTGLGVGSLRRAD